jgi:hypothetical protein
MNVVVKVQIRIANVLTANNILRIVKYVRISLVIHQLMFNVISVMYYSKKFMLTIKKSNKLI